MRNNKKQNVPNKNLSIEKTMKAIEKKYPFINSYKTVIFVFIYLAVVFISDITAGHLVPADFQLFII